MKPLLSLIGILLWCLPSEAASALALSNTAQPTVFTVKPSAGDAAFANINYVTVTGVTSASGAIIGQMSNANIQNIIGDISVTGGTSTTNMNFPVLTNVTGSIEANGGQTSLTNANFQALLKCKNWHVYDAINLASVNVSALKSVTTEVQASQMGTVAVVNFGSLTNCPAVSIGETAAVTSIILSNLVTVGLLQVADHPNMTNLDLSSLVTWNGQSATSFINNDTSLVHVSLPALKCFDGNMLCQNSALDATSVNGILHTLVGCTNAGGGIWGVGGWACNLSGGTSAAPTGQGITDKATLVSRGATVTTN